MVAAEATQTLGRYRLLRRIARGGMGEVWAAESLDDPTAPQVALKTMLSPEDAGPGLVAKFIGEARIGAAVSNHPNIVRTIDLGQQGERIFLVMELLDGRTLAQLAREDALVPEAVVGIAVPVLAALEHAQNAAGPNGEPLRLIHRDLKPGNLFITRDGHVKVIDFGIALVTGLDQTTTRTGTIRGSTAYLSPEQAQGEQIDGRSDLFALGAVLHGLLTGRRLFDQTTDVGRLNGVLFEKIPTVRERRPAVPEAVDAAVMSALERDREKRVQTAGELARALRDSIAPAQPWGTVELGKWFAERAVESTASATLVEPGLSMTQTDPSGGVRSVTTDVRERPAGRARTFGAAFMGTLLVVTGVALAGMLAAEKPAQETTEVASPEPRLAAAATLPEAEDVEYVAPYEDETAPARPRPRPKAAAELVQVTIDSRPWARISIDGKDFGPTPVVRESLASGVHQVQAVRSDGKRQTLKLKLVPGKDEKVLLEW